MKKLKVRLDTSIVSYFDQQDASNKCDGGDIMKRLFMAWFTVIVIGLTLFINVVTSTAMIVDARTNKGPAINIILSEDELSMHRGEAFLLSATPSVLGEITWYSSNTSVVTVAQYGLIRAVGNGTATVTVFVDSDAPGINSASCTVYVASSGIIANGTYFLENVAFEKFMDIEGPSTSNNAKMQIWDLVGNHPELKWIFSLGTDGLYRIKSVYSSKYVRVKGSSSLPGESITQHSTVVDGSKWSLMNTASGNYALVPLSSTDSLVVLNAPSSSNGANLKTVSYTSNSDYKDEWNPIRMLPLSGSELTYGEVDWSPFYNSVLGEWEYNNCYAYAINNQVYPGTNTFWDMQQPGEYSGVVFSSFTESGISSAVSNDYSDYNSDYSTNLAFYSISRYAQCPAGSYKVALVIGYYYWNGGLRYDYHWYRQDSDGLWSHKPGQTAVTRYDNSQKLIIDPQLADRNGLPNGGVNYNVFCGYYCVTPWSNILSRSKGDLAPDQKEAGVSPVSFVQKSFELPKT